MNALKLNLSKTSEDNQLQPVLKSKKINIFEKMEANRTAKKVI